MGKEKEWFKSLLTMKAIFNVLTFLVITSGCQNANEQQTNVDRVALYVVDKHIVTSIPLTESVLENHMELTPILIKNLDVMNHLDSYLTSMESIKKEGAKAPDMYSVKLMCKIFYKNGTIKHISHSGTNEIFYSGLCYKDNDHHFLRIIKSYIPKKLRWSIDDSIKKG